MIRKLKLCFLLSGILLGCKAHPGPQAPYEGFEAGSSCVSLEPGNSLFSLTLAGYGAPVEGRFTLEWIAQGEAPEIAYLAGCGDRLYGIDTNGGIVVLRDPLTQRQWQAVESTGAVKRMTAMQGTLYAVDGEGNFFAAKPSEKLIVWKSLAGSLNRVAALAASGKRLYAATSDDELFEGRRDGSRIAWERIGSAQSVIGMTGYGTRLFALTSNQLLWRREAAARDILWSKIGYNNGFTYDIDLRQIAVASDRLFSIGADGRLYAAQHSTRGNLTARALAFKKGGRTAVIVGVDLTGFDHAFVNEVKQEIFRRKGIPANAVLINASHTHFAPVTQGWYAWQEPNQYPDPLYMEQVVRPQIVRAVCEAVDNLRPAALYFGSGESRIGGNRCLPPEEALYDPTVDVIKVETRQNPTSEVLFLAGCHPVFRNAGAESFTINGNFPAVARARVTGGAGAANALFLQACGGDINPLYEDFNTMGNLLADDVLKVLERPMSRLEGEISCSLDSLLVPVDPWPQETVLRFREENRAYPGDLEAEKNVRWADLMLEKYRLGSMPRTMPIYVQTINIGNWKLIGLSREAVTQYGIEIRKLWPGQPVSVIGYTNDVCSYLPAAPHVRAHTYEGYNSFLWYAQPGFSPENILDTVVSFIRRNNR